MNEDWLEISSEDVNVEEIMRQIRERIARRDGMVLSEYMESPASVASALWQEMIEDSSGEQGLSPTISIRRRDCDIVPRHYAIDWRIPILGPIHAVVRRIINDEIRRYLMSSLRKQSNLNRRVLQVLKDLERENARLRQEIEELR
jgi:hypothetical protein